MSKASDRTTMGGSQEGFLTTQWSWIMGLGTGHGERQQAILDQIVRRYWKPVYCYLRRKGYSDDQAKDLTQGFFCEIVLSTSLIRRADKSRGRFRSLLLTALEAFVVDQHRSRSAKRRAPQGMIVSLDDPNVPELPSAAVSMDPAQIFSYVWATQILDEAIAEVERRCLAGNKETHWRLFQEKVLHPVMNGQPGPPWSGLCRRYGVADEKTASNMIITVKRCFQRVLADLLQRQVAGDSDLQQEFGDLFRHMAGPGAG
jgi:DNA-directed RNA polymerase specialized sigma24 family protein